MSTNPPTPPVPSAELDLSKNEPAQGFDDAGSKPAAPESDK